jgi:hypothetical protein
VEWRTCFPMLINVVAHFFDEFRHKVCTNRLVPAPLDFHASGAEISGIAADAGESFAMKGKNQRQPQFKDPALKCGLNGFDASVILAKAIAGFGGCPSRGIGN